MAQGESTQKSKSAFNLLAKKGVDGAEWWRGAVVYQIYPRSFHDSNGDGIGDLAGIVEKMDYIARLGVDAIWISPFFKSPMKDFGYDVSDYCDVDPIFGSLADFDQVLAAAKRHGIRLLIDLVLSHTSDQHHWFAESRLSRNNSRSDWYVWADPKPDGTPPNNWLSIFGGSAWEWNARRRQYYLHNFLASQPDLNFHNPEVQDAVLGVARFWLERGVDGFRLDTVNMYTHDADLRDNPPANGTRINGIPDENPYAMQIPCNNINRPENLSFVKRLRSLLDEFGPTTSIGEVGAVDDMYAAIRDYTAPGHLHMAYSFDFMTHEYSSDHVRSVVERLMAKAPDGWPNWAFSNHDVERVITRWGVNTPEAAPMLIALMTSLRGSACLYQGEELGLPEAEVPFDKLQDPYGIRFWPEFKGRDGCRTPIPWTSDTHGGFSQNTPWLPVTDTHRALSVANQYAEPSSPLNRICDFLNWRREHTILRVGSLEMLDAPDGFVVFIRELDGQRLLAAFNMTDAESEFDIPETCSPQLIKAGGFEHTAKLTGSSLTISSFGAGYVTLS